MLMPMISPGRLDMEVVTSKNSTGTSLVLPTGIATGDIIGILSTAASNPAPAAVIPAGFSAHINVASGNGRAILIAKEAAGDEAGATVNLMGGYIRNHFCFVLRPSRKVASIVAGPAAMNPVVFSGGNIAPVSAAPSYQGGYAIGVAAFMAADTGGDINWTRNPASPDITIDAGAPGGPAWEMSAWLFDQDPQTIVVDSPVNEGDYQTAFAGHLEFFS